MSNESFEYACEVLENAKWKIIGKSLNNTNPEKVYEMNILLFPVSYSFIRKNPDNADK